MEGRKPNEWKDMFSGKTPYPSDWFEGKDTDIDRMKRPTSKGKVQNTLLIFLRIKSGCATGCKIDTFEKKLKVVWDIEDGKEGDDHGFDENPPEEDFSDGPWNNQK